ncbi:MAG: hypothetical protein E7473_03785 [Ruminococcaceae bacterium]|nr:hypothetical protein [Oscillospiraceae bacterium]
MKNSFDYEISSGERQVIFNSGTYVLKAENKGEAEELSSFALNAAFVTDEYFVMEYRAVGIKRRRIKRAPVVFLLTENGERPLVCCDDLIFDGKRHRVIVKTEIMPSSGIRFDFCPDRRKTAELEICEMYICSKKELPLCCDESVKKEKQEFLPLDISSLFNAEFSGDDEKELEINAVFGICEENGIRMQCVVENTGTENAKAGVIFPAVYGLQYSSDSDSWYFFSKYQNINSNESTYIYEESAPSFPMQFFDIYSSLQQGGVSFTTRERDLTVRKYAIEKENGKICAYIEYPHMYGDIAPGESFVLSETHMNAHLGDWRKSFKLYRNWIKRWYKPYKCQDKKWYRESFWLLAEITDFFETDEIYSLPVWYDKEKKQCRFKEILEEQKSITGVYPDILHMWSWAFKGEGAGFT